MIKYNKVYRGRFYNQERDPVTNLAKNIVVTVDIYDTTSGEAADPTEIIELPMADSPVRLQSIDNEEDKFTGVIKSQRAIVNIHSSDTIGMETFADGGDTKFFGYIYCDAFNFILGHVSVGDVSEDLQPDPNVISLIITDGLGYLEDEDLVDEDGNAPTGIHDIWYYIRLALLKTGQSMTALVVFNIREKFALTLNDPGSIAGHFMKYCYLDARTFEGSDAGTTLTCAEVLRRILFGCYICQYNGEWLIVSVDEIQGDSDLKIFGVDEDGVFTNNGDTDNLKTIGVDLELSWMDDDAVKSSERPLRKYDLKRLYEYFKEIPCNSNFERGTGSEPTGAADETIDYTLECWRFLREGTDPEDLDQAPFTGSVGVLRKRFEYNYEKERYLVNATAGGFRHYFKSEGIRMAAQSKMLIGFQWKSATDTGGVTANIAHMRLVGDDGFVYDWELTTAGVSAWVQKNVTDPVFDTEWQQTISGIDDSEWQSISATSQPVPVAGTLFIRLLNDLASPDRYFSGLQVTYTPLVNNSYAVYTGERDTIEQEADTKAKREDQLYIGSGPDVNIKGVLQKRGTDLEIFSGTVDFGPDGHFEISGDQRPVFGSYIGSTIIIAGSAGNDQEAVITSINYSLIGNITQIFTDGTTTTEIGATVTISIATYVLAMLFYAAQVFPDGPPDDTYHHQYGELIAFNVWNQYNRVMRKFEGKIDGLDTDSIVPSLFHKFFLSDTDLSTGTRVFVMLHFSQDLHLCEWDVFLHEVHDPSVGKQYLGHSFRYINK